MVIFLKKFSWYAVVLLLTILILGPPFIHAQADPYYVTGKVYQNGQLIAPFGPSDSGANYRGPKIITLGEGDLDFQQLLRDLVARNDRGTLYSLVDVNRIRQDPDYVDQFRNKLYVYDYRGNISSSGGFGTPVILPTPPTGAIGAQQPANLAAQEATQSTPNPTSIPISTPTPTAAPILISTPTPTPYATFTPIPTSTPFPSPTPLTTRTPTSTPIPTPITTVKTLPTPKPEDPIWGNISNLLDGVAGLVLNVSPQNKSKEPQSSPSSSTFNGTIFRESPAGWVPDTANTPGHYNKKLAAQWAEKYAVEWYNIKEEYLNGCYHYPNWEIQTLRGTNCNNFVSTALCYAGWHWSTGDKNSNGDPLAKSTNNWFHLGGDLEHRDVVDGKISTSWIRVDDLFAFTLQSGRGERIEFKENDIDRLVREKKLEVGDLIAFGDSKFDLEHIMMVTSDDNYCHAAMIKPTKRDGPGPCLSYHSEFVRNASLHTIMNLSTLKNKKFFLLHLKSDYTR